MYAVSYFPLPGSNNQDTPILKRENKYIDLKSTNRVVHMELESLARDRPDDVWLSFIDGGSFTYSETWSRAKKVAAGFQRLGLEKGDRICVMIGNKVELVDLWFGAHAAGVIIAPMNIATKGESARHQVDLAAPKLIICEAEYQDNLSKAIESQGSACRLIIIDSKGTGLDEQYNESVQLYSSFLGEEDAYEPIHIIPTDTSAIAYTSGTTGLSKGIVWTHNYTLYIAEASAYHLEFSKSDTVYTCLPLYHVNALNMHLVPALLVGAKVVIGARFSVTRFWREINISNATRTNFLGSMLPLLIDKAPSEEERTHKVKKALVIPCPEEYYDILPERFGIRPYEAYGLADFGMLTWQPLDQEQIRNEVGVEDPGFEVLIVDDNDQAVPFGEIGELVARPRYADIASPGYWRDPEKTLESRSNLWFHTGDYMTQSANGWFKFVDRKKDAIRRRGENVASFEVEQAYLRHPGVIDCAAYAVKSDLLEDEIAICIVGKENAQYTPEDLLRFVEKDLPYFALPRYTRFVKELPRTANGKVLKRSLRDEGIKDCWDSAESTFVAQR